MQWTLTALSSIDASVLTTDIGPHGGFMYHEVRRAGGINALIPSNLLQIRIVPLGPIHSESAEFMVSAYSGFTTKAPVGQMAAQAPQW